jgi:hypothetical protein
MTTGKRLRKAYSEKGKKNLQKKFVVNIWYDDGEKVTQSKLR